MKDIKTGEYVRTRWGCIAKLESISKGIYEFDNIIMDESSAVREELFWAIIEKISPNIIDLIGIGDIIRGKDNHLFEVYAVGSDCVYINNLEEFILIKDIKGIVTKEAFESMEYRTGE